MVVMVKDGACSGPFASNHSSLHVPEPATPLQIAGPTSGASYRGERGPRGHDDAQDTCRWDIEDNFYMKILDTWQNEGQRDD